MILELNEQKTRVETLIARNIKRIRNKISYNKLTLISKLPVVVDVQDFLDSVPVLINNSTLNTVVFSCEINLRFMCSQEILFMDSTFDFCTKHFVPFVYNLCVFIYVFAAFCLLTTKRKSPYKELFQSPRTKCAEKGLVLLSKQVVAGFEIAIRSSLQKIFPKVRKIACMHR